MKEFTGKFNVQSAKIGIVVADFNETVTKQLVQGATEMLSVVRMPNVIGILLVKLRFITPPAAF